MSEKGFTLIEVAIVMVIIGVLMGGALRFTGIIEQARGKRVVADVTVLVDAQNRYSERMKRLAGDTDNDGIIDVTTLNSTQPDDIDTGSTDVDRAFDELQALGILPDTSSNALLSTTQDGAFMYFASTGTTNLIVVRNVQCAAAFQMEIQMDNSNPAALNNAGSGRVRRINGDTLETTASSWTTAGTACVTGGAVNPSATTNVAYILGTL